MNTVHRYAVVGYGFLEFSDNTHTLIQNGKDLTVTINGNKIVIDKSSFIETHVKANAQELRENLYSNADDLGVQSNSYTAF